MTTGKRTEREQSSLSIRLRLALCYGALFALILLLVIVLSYAIHARGQYDDLDRTLMVSAEHAAAEAAVSPTGPHLIQGDGGFEIVLRLYSPVGILLERTAGTEQLPSIDPRIVLRIPAGPAFDAVTSLVPPLAASAPATPDVGSVFGLLTTSIQRWRVYVLPFHTARSAGYIEVLTPLGRVDAAMQAFRLTLPILGLASFLVALLLSRAIAGNALRPIATMIETAQGIALSRDLSRRVQTPSHRDELGNLANTFNQMLESIETSYRTQQRFVVLQEFLLHPQQVLSKGVLLERIWGYDFDENVAEVYVKQLRQKLEAGGEPRLIQTIRGVGYVLRKEER
jgi:HAMP domain-containing protein